MMMRIARAETPLPDRLSYLIPLLTNYGDLFVGQEMKARVAQMTEDERREIADTLRLIDERGDWRVIDELFLSGNNVRPTPTIVRQILCLLSVFDHMIKSGLIPGFMRTAGERIEATRPPVIFDWSIVPSELRYLAPFADRYGRFQFDDSVDECIQNMTSEEFSELEKLAAHVRARGDFGKVNAWLDEYDMVKHPEANRMYFLFGVLDAMNLRFD
jgi:hypothetical protein